MGGAARHGPTHQLKAGVEFGLGADQLHGGVEGAPTLPHGARKRNGWLPHPASRSPTDR